MIYQLLLIFVAPWIFTSLYKAKDYRFIVFLSSLTLSFSSFLRIDLLNGRVLGNISPHLHETVELPEIILY